jgi:hypothetical protein
VVGCRIGGPEILQGRLDSPRARAPRSTLSEDEVVMDSNVAELGAGLVGAAPAGLQALLLRAQAGGPGLWVSLGLGGLALALMAERALALRAQPDGAQLMERVAKLVASGNLQRAAKLCAASAHEPIARIASQGLRRAPEGPAAVRAALASALAEASPRAGRRLRWLGGLSAAAGLAGAVPGLLALVREGSLTEPARGALVDGGVVALAVSAGCFAAHRLLATAARRRTQALTQQAQRLEGLLARRLERTESGSLRALETQLG